MYTETLIIYIVLAYMYLCFEYQNGIEQEMVKRKENLIKQNEMYLDIYMQCLYTCITSNFTIQKRVKAAIHSDIRYIIM